MILKDQLSLFAYRTYKLGGDYQENKVGLHLKSV